MYLPIELNDDNAELWRSLTKEQKNVITILAENYDEVNFDPDNEDWTFPQAISIGDVDAATYTTSEQYIVWRSITTEQKNLVFFVWDNFTDKYAAALAAQYDREEVENMNVSYNMFSLYNMFTAQDQFNDIDGFRFFNNPNN
jgi:hypothetical protein